MNPRDHQIATIGQRTERLRSDRLQECYDQIVRAYEAESIVEHIARVVEEEDRSPSDFRVLTNSESRHLWQFNDDSYYWDRYCWELGRSISLGERRYLFEQLQTIPSSSPPIDAAEPNFQSVLNAVDHLTSRGYHPDVLCAPIGLFVPFSMDRNLTIDWNSSPREVLMMAGRPQLKILWSSRSTPLDQFVVFDSRAALWRVKLDPVTTHRLTVAIGEPQAPRDAVMFLAETVVKYEIKDTSAFRAISVEGEYQDEYT